MTINEKILRLTADDKTPVLILTLKTPIGISERADKFYTDASAEFEKSVCERLLVSAKEAYEESPDRRKRYRYLAWQAAFICIPKEENQVEIVISANGNILRKETHYWRKNELLKRKKIM